MPNVYRQAYFGAKKELVANGTADRDPQSGNLVARELTQKDCEQIVAERQASVDGFSYTIE